VSEEHTLDEAAQALHTMLSNIYIANVYPTRQQTRAFTALLALGIMEYVKEQEADSDED
jgi:predicted DNA-binding ribbon-helix-helix protein